MAITGKSIETENRLVFARDWGRGLARCDYSSVWASCAMRKLDYALNYIVVVLAKLCEHIKNIHLYPLNG